MRNAMRKLLPLLLLALAAGACNRSSVGSALTWGNDTLMRFGERDVVGLISIREMVLMLIG